MTGGANGQTSTLRGRFAPSPSGRMHLGNIATALVSWLSVKCRKGKWVLRIEDLDPQRSKETYMHLIEDDLHWLGLEWDEGGLESKCGSSSYRQSQRTHLYNDALHRLNNLGLTYPCFCSRADIMATQAPHQSDGRIVYCGTCRPEWLKSPKLTRPVIAAAENELAGKTVRLYVPDRTITFCDRIYGPQSVNLADHCGDFILRRKDGAWAYQLAVVVDDGDMGITEVVRGNDLLLSSAQQIYLYHLLGLPVPEFAHIPLVCNADGKRLSKRDSSLSMEVLRNTHSPEEVIGRAAYHIGIIDNVTPCRPDELIDVFDWDNVKHTESVCL